MRENRTSGSMRRGEKRVMVHSADGHRTRKGGNSGAPPDLHTTALALHSTEDVDAAEAVDRCLGGGDGLCLVVDVERRGKQVALSAEGGRDGIGISRRGDHEVTALERVACDLEAEATRRTGDEPNLLAVRRHVRVLSVVCGV
jgi:hypothetical protein